ncbi:MAG TPA: RIP metalloprotease RseP [Terriglobia bacterium]|jgi:regulator of sigma E protease|nr:RIP metalloprotease RseP [Terriglobia bacterium]
MLSNAATDIVVVVIALGLMVFIHELGHFLAAKWVGVRILTFSFGFGKRLLGVKHGQFSLGGLEDESEGTDYRLSLLPLGGYVKMAGEDPSQPQTGDAGEFLARPRWQRFFIVIMGPAMNIVLAVLLLTGLNRYHDEEPAFEMQQARIGEVAPDSVAAQAGIEPGDLITRLGDLQNPTWQDVDLKVAMSPNASLPVEVLRNGERVQAAVTPRPEGREELGTVGWEACLPAQVDEIEPGAPAARAGIQKGDRIVAMNGKPVLCSQALISSLQDNQGKPAEVSVARAGQNLRFIVSPYLGNSGERKQWLIGVGLRYVIVKQLPWPKAFTASIDENIKTCELSFDAVGKILTRQMSARSLSGPIAIAQMSGEAYRAGIPDLISVSAAVSLSLGIFNLLPVPILDGGVILLLLIETVIRRDLSLRVKERVVQVGLALLLLLTVFVMYNDLVKTFRPY